VIISQALPLVQSPLSSERIAECASVPE